MEPRHRSLIELNVAVLLWGGTALFAKWIALPAFQISGLRSVVAALALLGAIGFWQLPLRPRDRRDLGLLVLLGALLAAHWVSYFKAIQLSTVAIGILSLHTYPVITALVEPALFGEKFHLGDLALAVVVVVGAVILVPAFSLESRMTQGVLYGVVSALFFTARNLLSRWLLRRYAGLQIMFYQFSVCALVLVPLVVWAGRPVSGPSAAQLLVLGILFTALPQTLFTNSMRHLTTKTVSIIATALPIYGALLAAILLQEIPSLRTCVGGAIILGAVFFETWKAVRGRNASARRPGEACREG